MKNGGRLQNGQSEMGHHLAALKPLVELALGAHLKPVLVGATITSECLQDASKLKVIWYCDMRVQLMTSSSRYGRPSPSEINCFGTSRKSLGSMSRTMHW
jgi:hypothetical protein